MAQEDYKRNDIKWGESLRVDLSQIPVQGGLQVKTKSGAFADSLKEGDRVRVDILSAEKDAVVVKTEGGQIFRAKLDTDAVLSQGDRVLLEFSGKEGKLVFLSILGSGAESGGAANEAELVRDFEDKSLAPYARKLADLNMAVNEGTARLMREIVTQNPGMTLEEAAFLASNKLAGDEGLIKAALALLSNGEKTDAMLARLIALLGGSDEYADPAKAQLQGTEPNTLLAAQETNPQMSSSNAQLVAREDASPLTDFLRLIAEALAGADAERAAQSLEQTALSDDKTVAQNIIPQNDTILQSGNVIKNVEIPQNENISIDKPVSELENMLKPQAEANVAGQNGVPNDLAQITAGETDRAALQTTNASLDQPNSTLQTQKPAFEAGRAIAELLANLPEFQNTPVAALEKFSNTLLRIAKESSDASSSGIEKLTALLDQLFTRIERNDKDAGERLRSAREEIFARLALVEESIARASLPAKAEMLEQTRKLMDHVRTLNNIDQFIYVQLPVHMGDERKTAELYLFRKKNGKKIDPDNANILLVLDLENMGHWEGLINIREKDVSIQMEVRGESEKEFFSEKTVMLHEFLSEAGFRLVNTDISYNKEETTPLTALDVLNKYLADRTGVVDVTI